MIRQFRQIRDLNAEGYRFFQSPQIWVVDVVKPDGTVYHADTWHGTCDCLAGKRGVSCCHLREAVRLMMDGRALPPMPAPRPAPVEIRGGFPSREAFEKARAADFG